MRRMRSLALAFALSACTVSIDEGSVFRPQPHPEPAETAEQLSRWPLAQLRGVVPSAEARHGFLETGAGRIAYTVVSKPGDEPRPLIVYCGGNSGDRTNSGVFYALKALPYGDVVLFDYPGYGDSPGEPSAEAIEAMAPSVATLAADVAGERPLVFWGHSLGGFICSRIASETAAADAVVLEATARNALEIAEAWRPWFTVPFVRLSIEDSLAAFDVAETLSGFQGPVLVLGARRDRTLPVRLSRDLVTALRTNGARVTYVEFPRAQHLDITRQPNFPGVAAPFFASLAGPT